MEEMMTNVNELEELENMEIVDNATVDVPERSKVGDAVIGTALLMAGGYAVGKGAEVVYKKALKPAGKFLAGKISEVKDKVKSKKNQEPDKIDIVDNIENAQEGEFKEI